jgi:glutathione S-transferase
VIGVLIADAVALAVLALAVWVMNGAHLPVDLAHTLAAQAATAVAMLIALTETHRWHRRMAGRHAADHTNTTSGGTDV